MSIVSPLLLARVDKRTFFCQLGTCSHLEINPLTSKEEGKGAFFLRNEPPHMPGATTKNALITKHYYSNFIKISLFAIRGGI